MKTTTKTIHYLEIDDDEMQNLRRVILMARRLSENNAHSDYPGKYQDTFDTATQWLQRLPTRAENDVAEYDLKYDINGHEIKGVTT